MSFFPQGIDVDAFVSGLQLGALLVVTIWGAVLVIALMRKFLTEAF